jgi:hypothetical protein
MGKLVVTEFVSLDSPPKVPALRAPQRLAALCTMYLYA